MQKRSVWRSAASVGMFLLLIGALSVIGMPALDRSASAAEKEDRAEIIEKAKKEKELMLYTGVNFNDVKALSAAFEKKYPFLKVGIYRAGSAVLLNRSQTEYKAGHYAADSFGSSLWAAQQFYEAGLLGTYKSPERDAITDAFKDKDGYWTCDYINVAAITYNTKLVPPERIPKSYQDFLDPWWKGKVAMDDAGGLRWYGSMLMILGEEKGRAFMQKLAQQNVSVRRGQSLISQLLAAGEFAAIINSHNNDAETLKNAGAAVDWIAPIDQPTITTPHTIAIAKNPPHPNAAKLYIDFILSKEGQQMIANLTNTPVRPDVSPNPPRLVLGPDGKRLKFLAIDFDLAKRVFHMQKEFRELFQKKK